MTETLTAENFEPLLRQQFSVEFTSGDVYLLELEKVQYVGEPFETGARRPFSLWFTNPLRDAYLPQQVYRLEHPQLGAIDVFMVPLGLHQNGMRYEVIFS